VRPRGLHFDFDERTCRDKRRNLYGASCGLFGCSGVPKYFV
jgi:hypothetical protein